MTLGRMTVYKHILYFYYSLNCAFSRISKWEAHFKWILHVNQWRNSSSLKPSLWPWVANIPTLKKMSIFLSDFLKTVSGHFQPDWDLVKNSFNISVFWPGSFVGQNRRISFSIILTIGYRNPYFLCILQWLFFYSLRYGNSFYQD